jgi:filamentous hemagglutinin family protein
MKSIYQRHPALGLLLLLSGQLWCQGSFQAPVQALPQNGQVQVGQATIQQPNGQQLTIQQQSDRAVIDWQSFSIGAQEQVQINQPNVNAALLNRVTGATPSSIAGTLRANGQVMLVNPNGVVFTPTAVVDVGGILATTLNISNLDFMAGKLNLYQEPGMPLGTVENQGSITVAEEGLAALVAPNVRNSGVINARLGQVVLAAGTQATLDFYGDGLIAIAVPDELAARLGIEQTGSLQADGGWVAISAATGASLLESVVNTDGIVRARAVENRNGTIVLTGGDVTVAGTVDASGNGLGEAGGTIEAIAQNRITVSSSALLDASGYSQGGFVDTSGEVLDLQGRVDTRGIVGPTGTWLIDPSDITIDAALAATLSTNLATTNQLVSTAAGTGGNGDITLGATVSSTSANSLTLEGRRFSVSSGTFEIAGPLIFNLNAVNPEDTVPTTSVNAAIAAIGTGTVPSSTTINLGNGPSGMATVQGATLNFNQAANITVQGTGQTTTFLDGQNRRRVATISAGTVTLKSLTLRNGRINNGDGGGIFNSGGTVNINHSTISGNSSSSGFRNNSSGGGIFNSGTLSITNSTISDNSISSYLGRGGGGGIFSSGSLSITGSTISSNSIGGSRGGSGGGIFSSGTLSIANSTISGNTVNSDATRSGGGGIFSSGTLLISNSTISDNSHRLYSGLGGGGGGISNSGTLSITNSTISGNNNSVGAANGLSEPNGGGGIFNTGTLSITNSTISTNSNNLNDYDYNTYTEGGGGGIFNGEAGTVSLANFTISGNSHTNRTPNLHGGGGIYNRGGLSILDSTISGNSSIAIGVNYYGYRIGRSYGGGIYSFTPTAATDIDITNSTVSGNTSSNGGGGSTVVVSFRSLTQLSPTIVAVVMGAVLLTRALSRFPTPLSLVIVAAVKGGD